MRASENVERIFTVRAGIAYLFFPANVKELDGP